MSAPARVRLFVALELPEPVVQVIVDWRERVVLGRDAAGPRAASGLRAVPSASMHVTLCFLGWRVESEIASISEGCQAVAACPAPRLMLGDALWLPPRRPRVLAVELTDEDGALSRAQAHLSRALEAAGFYRPEKRPFLAHVTVARVASARGVDGARRFRPAALVPPPSQAFSASLITLFRSQLSPAGARYEPLASVELIPPK